jgi:phosphoribosyl 1,2-cyclic phosphodiesterase
VKVALWGTRGSLPAPGPESTRYGGNTPCVEVRAADGTTLVLDAGSGIRRLGDALAGAPKRLDLLLSHLHMDHVQGMGFFAPLYDPAIELHIWGPASLAYTLRQRLTRYLSPPLFPVQLRDLPRPPVLHEVPCDTVQIGAFTVTSERVCHPGPTVGYRIEADGVTLVYLPDHEPALGARHFPMDREWTSAGALAAGADLLIHDAQFSVAEYPHRVGWGHSAMEHALAFAALAEVKHLVLFHHDPGRSDAMLDQLTARALEAAQPLFMVTPGAEGMSFELGSTDSAGRKGSAISPGPHRRSAAGRPGRSGG